MPADAEPPLAPPTTWLLRLRRLGPVSPQNVRHESVLDLLILLQEALHVHLGTPGRTFAAARRERLGRVQRRPLVPVQVIPSIAAPVISRADPQGHSVSGSQPREVSRAQAPERPSVVGALHSSSAPEPLEGADAMLKCRGAAQCHMKKNEINDHLDRRGTCDVSALPWCTLRQVFRFPLARQKIRRLFFKIFVEQSEFDAALCTSRRGRAARRLIGFSSSRASKIGYRHPPDRP